MRFSRNILCRLEWAQSFGDDPFAGQGPSTFYFTFQIES